MLSKFYLAVDDPTIQALLRGWRLDIRIGDGLGCREISEQTDDEMLLGMLFCRG